jgi:hypothetical protein
MNELSTAAEHALTDLARATPARSLALRQAWLAALEDASISRSPRWMLGDASPRPADDARPPRTEVKAGAFGTTADMLAIPAEPEVGVEPATGALPADKDGVSTAWLTQRLPGQGSAIPSSARIAAESSETGADIAPRERLLPRIDWQPARWSLLMRPDGSMELWVRDAGVVDEQRVQGLLRQLMQGFGRVAAEVVSVGINGRVVYRARQGGTTGNSGFTVLADSREPAGVMSISRENQHGG